MFSFAMVRCNKQHNYNNHSFKKGPCQGFFMRPIEKLFSWTWGMSCSCIDEISVGNRSYGALEGIRDATGILRDLLQVDMFLQETVRG
jgi:hypothetical protein